MANLNRCTFIGNVTRDIEMRYAPSGDAIANFSIAVNETWKDKQGVKQERAEFINIVAYRKLAEIIGEYVKKGSSIYIEGKMQTRKWENDGVTRYATEIIADQMQMLGGKGSNNDSVHDTRTGEESEQTSTSKSAPAGGTGFDDFEDDIPF
jgi:single-strand DNA-binding protein